MNVLASKRTVGNKLEGKGEPLGKVGIVIVCGFVGLVFATALIGAKATTNNSSIQIESTDSNGLTATDARADSRTVSWSWLKSSSATTDHSFNNSDVLAQECASIDESSENSITQASISASGSGQSVSLDSDSVGALYCFIAVSGDTTDYGGYIVSPHEVID